MIPEEVLMETHDYGAGGAKGGSDNTVRAVGRGHGGPLVGGEAAGIWRREGLEGTGCTATDATCLRSPPVLLHTIY